MEFKLALSIMIPSIMYFALGSNKVNTIQDADPAVSSMLDPKLEKEKLLRHVVIFKFNNNATDEDIDRLNKSFAALATKIPVVKDFEWGLNDSPEDFHQGFTHCYMLTFSSERDRDEVYSPHPEHKAFVESLQPYLEKVFVVDYWVQE